ncbi:hypothetical protein [Cohnella fermenti]|uniref:Uncharacterized protein n=1 Tax=Cohnella fermenti TaxID=2565925 RepID=A0A4V3WEH5_9BACL|nr:hypothetical protein [Cohnella fermenti]THF76368.1 hypothetical protein E6C55_19020 [Cohnella fermenti]
MILLMVAFAAIGWIEWSYLKKHTRKPKTKVWVMAFVAAAFLYNAIVWRCRIPPIDPVLTRWLGPIQQRLLGN